MPSGGIGSSTTAWPRASRAALVVVGVAWAGVLLAITPQRIYLTTDMVSNHVHVWFIASRLWHGHGIPLHMPVLASGDAFTFPYASLPWLVGALLWPLGGDHVVTVLLVVGAVAVIATTYWAIPGVRRGWWAVAVLLNPALLTSVLLGQLPFLWAAALFLGAIGAWRRERRVVATALLALSLIVHPAVMLPISIVIVGIAVVFLRDRGRLALAWLVAVVLSVPAIVLTLDSPVVDQTSRRFELLTLGLTVLTRVWVIAVPLVYEQLARIPGSWGRLALPLGFSVLSLGLFLPMWRPFSLDTGWAALAGHAPADELHSFVTTPSLAARSHVPRPHRSRLEVRDLPGRAARRRARQRAVPGEPAPGVLRQSPELRRLPGRPAGPVDRRRTLLPARLPLQRAAPGRGDGRQRAVHRGHPDRGGGAGRRLAAVRRRALLRRSDRRVAQARHVVPAEGG